jgi:uncharacterized membrane protein
MLVLVMGSMAGFAYLGWVLGYWGMALLQIAVSTLIILLFIRNFNRWFGPR